MEYRIDHDLPTKEELIQYSKDTIGLMRQNIWLVIKLIISGVFFSAIIGFIVKSFELLGIYLTRTGASPDFVLFFYEGVSDTFSLVFTSVPFWLILFYTGFKLMEKKIYVVPIGYVIKTHVSFTKYFWTKKFFLLCLFILIALSALFPSTINNHEPAKEMLSYDIGYLVSAGVYGLSTEGMKMGFGFYWFSFIHLMIFSALLFGRDLIPNIPFTLKNIYYNIPLNKRVKLLLVFVVIDLVNMLACALIIALAPPTYNFIVGTLVSGIYYLFVSGVLYCYCVDKIEGRKLKVSAKESVFESNAVPESA